MGELRFYWNQNFEYIIQYYTVYILRNHVFLPHVDNTPLNKDTHGNPLGSS
jgi:hypothetical protein